MALLQSGEGRLSVCGSCLIFSPRALGASCLKITAWWVDPVTKWPLSECSQSQHSDSCQNYTPAATSMLLLEEKKSGLVQRERAHRLLFVLVKEKDEREMRQGCGRYTDTSGHELALKTWALLPRESSLASPQCSALLPGPSHPCCMWDLNPQSCCLSLSRLLLVSSVTLDGLCSFFLHFPSHLTFLTGNILILFANQIQYII